MKFMHATPKAIALGLMTSIGCAAAMASMPDDLALNADQAGGAARMSTTLSSASAIELFAKASRARATQTAGITDAKLGEPRFDLSVNNAPAAQVFMQLGMGTNYNILLPPDLTGTISVNLKNTTVPEALDTLRELFGYDFRISGNRVFVSSNAVQTRLYRINYLPGRRQGVSELTIESTSNQGSGASSGSSGSGSGASGSGASSSSGSLTSSVKTTTDTDFWKDVNDSLLAMVGTKDGRGVTINAGAGVIVVRATSLELKHVAEYLRAIQITIERQVMLEAKIVEVQLSKSSESGINWSLFRGTQNGERIVGGVGVGPGTSLKSSGAISNASGSVTAGVSAVAETLGKGFYGVAVQSGSFTALLSFLESQGNVQVLSSPRIAALNNQKAVLKVGSDDTFVSSVTNNVTVVNNSTVNSPTVTTKTYFSGISLDVTPQIDGNGIVMLHVHPAISVATKKDLLLTLGAGSYDVPGVAVAINETDSMVRVRDGQILAIGGLMQQSASRTSDGVPGLGDAPIIGSLFRYKTSNDTKRELVILIKPTVVSDDGTGSNPEAPDTPLLSSANVSK
jgi:MSHA biogenesis protein MshL